MTATVSVLAGNLDHPEGVAALPDGSLVAGGEAGQIYLIKLDGTVENIGDTGGFCLGLAVDEAGSIYVCDMGRHAVLRLIPSTGTVEDLTTGISEVPVRIPNYPVFDAFGRLYFSDSGEWGKNDGVLHVRYPDGRVEVASREASGYTNGLAIDPAQEFLYVVESSVPAITRCRLLENGALGPREVFFAMEHAVPDGIAFCADGTLLIACYRPDTVYTYRDGVLAVLATDEKGLSMSAPTNVAFFGEELNRLAYANLASSFVGEIHCDLVGAPKNYPAVDK
jgi:gluconolactonase